MDASPVDSLDAAPADSMGAATGLRVGQHGEQPPDSASSKEMAPDSSEQVASPDSEMTPLDFVPDSLLPESQPSLCVRCGTTHASNEYSEACRSPRG